MPELKPQELKALSTIDLQPHRITSRVLAIMMMDISGKGTGEIAATLGMTAARVSVIKGSPMYIRRRAEEYEKLSQRFLEKQTDKIIDSPVREVFSKAALEAAKVQINVLRESKSDFARLGASDRILENAGFRPKNSKIAPEIRVESKVVNRFYKVMEHAQQTRFSVDARESADSDSEDVS